MQFVSPPRIVIVAGQSNMVGYRTTVQDLAPRWRKAQDGCFYWKGTGWIPLQANKMNQKSAFGPELTLAQRLAGIDESPVGIVKVARNGSYLERHWSPARTDGLFSKLIDQSQAALASGKSHLYGMIWLQGEADSLNEEDANLYRRRFTNFINQVRTSLSAPTMPVIAGIVNPPEDRCVHRDKVRRSLKRAPLENYETVPMDDLELQRDRLHLSHRGLALMGKRFARELGKRPKPSLVHHWFWNSSNYQCWYTGPEAIPEHVVVSFPFAVAKSGYDEFGFGQRAFDKRETGTIYIRSNASNWFQHDEVFQIAAKIRDYVGADTELTLYGASMGAYAALLLSGSLRPKRIFAIAPQFSIDRKIVPWETRWSRSAARIKDFQYDLIEHIDPSAQKTVFYDSTSVDRQHIDLLPVDETWDLVKLPHASHQVLRYLRETGCLSLLVDLITKQDGEIEKLALMSRANRRKSSIYWMTLAKACAPRHPTTALKAFQEAIACGGPPRKIQKHIDRLLLEPAI